MLMIFNGDRWSMQRLLKGITRNRFLFTRKIEELHQSSPLLRTFPPQFNNTMSVLYLPSLILLRFVAVIQSNLRVSCFALNLYSKYFPDSIRNLFLFFELLTILTFTAQMTSVKNFTTLMMLVAHFPVIGQEA